MLAKEKLNGEQQVLAASAFSRRRSLYRKICSIDYKITEYEPTFKELCENIPAEESPMCYHDEIEQKIDKYLEIHHEF